MIVDKPLAELEQYRPSLTMESDFEAFWQSTLAESDAQPLHATVEEHPYPVKRLKVYAVRYDGFGPETRVAGWYIVPDEAYRLSVNGKTPTIVFYHGYGGYRGLPTTHLRWALQGFCVFAVDTRGQNGDTPDNAIYPAGSALGNMSRGILDPQRYFYRYAYADCVRAVDFVRSRPEVGPIIVSGISQGGGLTLAVAALARDKGIVAAMPDIPYLCDFRRSLELFTTGPYIELVNFWKAHPYHVETSYRTLSYFDGMNLAAWITCPTILSVGLLDTTCPASTCLAVYNHLAGEKEIKIYPYNGHDGGGEHHEEEKYRFAYQVLERMG